MFESHYSLLQLQKHHMTTLTNPTFGDDTGESAPRFAKLVKLRREANGDLGIIVIVIIVMKVRKTEI